MFVLKKLWSLFQRSEEISDDDFLSLDDAYRFVRAKEVQNRSHSKTAEHEPECTINDYETFKKIGKITQIVHDVHTIDNLYSFLSSRNDFLIGTKVSYHLTKTAGILEVNNVMIIENDWDVIETGKRKWCDRTLVASVSERNGRILTVTPGNLEINLNEVASEFLPCVGDWLDLDIKCELDEKVDDLSGKILEIKKIRPLRSQVVHGTISIWEDETKEGVINREIYFDSSALYGGYIPARREHVTVECIESSQGTYNWRALKVIPDYLKLAKKGLSGIYIQNDFQSAYPDSDVTITDGIHLTFSQLQEIQPFKITVTNNQTSEDVLLKRLELPRTDGQCKILTSVFNVTIKPGESLTISGECQASKWGEQKEILLLYFDKATVERWIKTVVGQPRKNQQENRFNNSNRNNSNSNSKPRFRNKPYKIEEDDDKRVLIRGRRLNQAPRFKAVKIPEYAVPKNVLQTVAASSQNFSEIRDSLLAVKPVLTKTLSYINYEDRFHTLVHLEEIKTLQMMTAYDQDKACFVKSGEYLMLEIENLAERRPSVIVGDRVIARDLYKKDTPDHEGCVHKIGKQHVYLKFSQAFHDSYDGEDYSIKVVAGRTVFRREHHGISMAARDLGLEVLFPSKIVEKEPQVEFTADCDLDTKQSMNFVSKIETELHDESFRQENGLKNGSTGDEAVDDGKLDWYNKSLNYFQKEAVRNCLLGVCRPLPYIIFGPPGTGKTVTVVEAVLQIVRLLPQSRILLSAPSNSAADLLALRLIDSGVLKPGDLVRLVSMTAAPQISAKLAPYAATGSLEKDGVLETEQPFVANNGLTLGVNSATLGRHKITVCTCSSAGLLAMMGLPHGHFTHVIVDEAGQTSEPSLMIPLSLLDVTSGQAILAGDPMQLGPVVLSLLASEYGLEESFLERLINRFPYIRDHQGFPQTFGYDPRLITKLVLNYRALPVLLKLPSLMFYNNDLIPTISDTHSDEARLLRHISADLPKTKYDEPSPIIFHGCTGENYQTEDSPSWYNPNEAAYVYYYLNLLYQKGLKSTDVGIITPYKAQTKQLLDLCKEAESEIPKIGTVEDFQGQEFNVIILSTVRSTDKLMKTDLLFKLGFVANSRRLNVSITRAKSLLIIVGNPYLLSADKFWKQVIDYCAEHGSYVGCKLNLGS